LAWRRSIVWICSLVMLCSCARVASTICSGQPNARAAAAIFSITFSLFFSLLWAVSLAGAIGMILELEKGFGGLIHVSPQPMRQAVDESEAQLHE